MSSAKHNVRLEKNESGRFEVRWRECANDTAVHKRKSLRTTCEQEAQTKLSQFLLVATKKADYTVAQAWAIRQAETLRNTHDPQRIRDAWKALLPVFGNKSIASLTQEDFNNYVEERTDEGRAISTVRRELGELQTTLKAMVDSRRVSYDDLPKLTLPTAENARPNFLTEEQKAMLLLYAHRRGAGNGRSRLELFIRIGLETGQRKRAIEELEWDQVDFTARMIHFRKVGERLTKKRKPSVPMSDDLEEVLREEYERRVNAWVLRNSGSIRTSFENAVEALGLEKITPHSLRHTFVSHMLMRGESIYDVAQLVGVTVKMVEQTYGHLTPEYLRSILNRR